MSTDGETSLGPLSGVRVVDLSNTVMVPYTTLLMAQMGADVVKVEPPEGDILRKVGDTGGSGFGPVYINANYGKKSVVLDLKSPAGRQALLRLIDRADVFVHNRPRRSARNLGIEYEALAKDHPRLIYCSACGYGSDGPYCDLPAYDDVIQAACGMADIQTNGGKPAYVRTAVADKTAALFALGGIMAALYERERSGLGQAIEVPMFESMISFLMLEHQGGAVFDPPRGPTGYVRMSSENRHPFRTSDGLIGVMIYTDSQWAKFFTLIHRPRLADDPRFSSMTERTANTDLLYSLVEDVLKGRSTEAWITILGKGGIPVMRVNSIDEILDDDHVRATGLIERHDDPVVGATLSTRLPIKFSRSVPAKTGRPPLLGEHNSLLDEIFEETKSHPN
jgi:crotonobetainyl-CoA:carnitine CoA-transferase CaiB-like acyl-CoA transferase